jgi:glycosyltransferase involved in cell wall biosynthesis
MRESDIFVVIPSYNEGIALRATVTELEQFGFTIVVVDDGSDVPAMTYLDGKRIRYLRHASNLGQGAALQTGTDYALSRGARYVVHFDADGQHSPSLVQCLIAPISTGECDITLGSRFLNDHDRRQVPLKKRLVLRVGVFVSWVFTGLWLTDTHNGLRALSRRAAQQIRMSEDGFAHATEVLELVRRSGLKYKEVPTTIRYTDYSKAKGQSIFNGINIVIDLVLRKLPK